MRLRSAGDKDLEPFDPEIERTVRHLRAAARKNKPDPMGDRVPMRNLANPTGADIRVGIQAPTLDATINFEVKHGTIQLVQHNQFGGSPSEDPHGHLRNFEKVCNTFKMRDRRCYSIAAVSILTEGMSSYLGGEHSFRNLPHLGNNVGSFSSKVLPARTYCTADGRDHTLFSMAS
ncbi:LOW QUALITY PROTEIN: hypothetical protein OSB04_023555 [Centaurea solstitialis]|uniref:Reverse transcriptase domain-containing protein n=1 Tax=Centaurea solstitialis TaxID=347529 RepID=A0AA38T420_9ASTR|nr:LOW QUALITY PROTEIN: hypothetical protein OSB04_023555 [Centaurea solstitialis]